MRTSLRLLPALTLVLSLAACGGSKDEQAPAATTSAPVMAPTSIQTPEEALSQASEELKSLDADLAAIDEASAAVDAETTTTQGAKP